MDLALRQTLVKISPLNQDSQNYLLEFETLSSNTFNSIFALIFSVPGICLSVLLSFTSFDSIIQLQLFLKEKQAKIRTASIFMKTADWREKGDQSRPALKERQRGLSIFRLCLAAVSSLVTTSFPAIRHRDPEDLQLPLPAGSCWGREPLYAGGGI